MKKSSIILMALLGVFALTGCSSDDEKKIYDFVITENNITIADSGVAYFEITSGNGDYEFSYDKEEISDITFRSYSQTKFGGIMLSPRKTGEFKVTVTDKLTKQTQELKVKVVNSALQLSFFSSAALAKIKNTEDKNKIEELVLKNEIIFSEQNTLVLVRNKNKDLYLFENESKAQTGNFISKGNYSIKSDSPTSEIMKLELTYRHEKKDYNIEFLIDDDRSMAFFKFLLITANPEQETRMYLPPPKAIYLRQDFTELYKPSYPELESVYLSYFATVLEPTYIGVPSELLED